MLDFSIHFAVTNSRTMDERGHMVINQNINDEWTIVFVCEEDELTAFKGFLFTIDSIEIHRKNITIESSVSGELRFIALGFELFESKFSQIIKIGQLYTRICSNINYEYYDDVLCTGLVKITDISEKQLKNEESKFKIEQKSLEGLSNDFGRLLQPDSTCIPDITLKCNGVSIPAHKTILSARSSVFAAMFAHPMKESLKNEVDITDMDESALSDLLKYIYAGKTSDMTVDSAANLLFAADKYKLQDLKTVCVYFLKNTVTLQNVWRIICLGDMYSTDLKSFAVDYICNNCGKFSVVENTQEWKDLRKGRPDLAMDLLESLVKYRDEK